MTTEHKRLYHQSSFQFLNGEYSLVDYKLTHLWLLALNIINYDVCTLCKMWSTTSWRGASGNNTAAASGAAAAATADGATVTSRAAAHVVSLLFLDFVSADVLSCFNALDFVHWFIMFAPPSAGAWWMYWIKTIYPNPACLQYKIACIEVSKKHGVNWDMIVFPPWVWKELPPALFWAHPRQY